MNRTSALSLWLLAGLACGMLAGAIVAGKFHNREGCTTVRDTTTVVDTIMYIAPAATDSEQIRYVTRYLPVVRHDTIIAEIYTQKNGEIIPSLLLSDERDSAAVEIPITQKCYEGDEYRAYVSGYEPCLDSIFVFAPTTIVRECERKPPRRWHIGITGGFGYGITEKRVEPFVGVGITYSIISF